MASAHETADLRMQALAAPDAASVNVSATDMIRPKRQCKD